MVADGDQVFAAVQDRAGPVKQLVDLDKLGVRILSLSWPRRNPVVRAVRRLVRPLTGPVRHPFEQVLRTAKPDLVVHSLPFHLQGVEEVDYCRNQRIPYMMVVHASNPYHGVADDQCDVLCAAYENALACCFVSNGNRREVEAVLGLRLRNTHIVRNPYNVSYDAAPAWPGEADGYRLACVGRLEHSAKGQDLLFEILSTPKWRQRPVKVSLMGSGPAERALRRLAGLYNLGDKLEFSGFNQDITKVWANNHLHILPSRFEGLPLSVVEAMLCGRANVVTDVEGNAELLQDGVTGFVAKAPTVQLFDEALDRAWERRGDWHRMGQAAAGSVRQEIPRDPVGVFVSFIRKLGSTRPPVQP
jgi:glycosyltransferase involved in cell wall biosynthesis